MNWRRPNRVQRCRWVYREMRRATEYRKPGVKKKCRQNWRVLMAPEYRNRSDAIRLLQRRQLIFSRARGAAVFTAGRDCVVTARILVGVALHHCRCTADGHVGLCRMALLGVDPEGNDGLPHRRRQ